MLNEKHLITKTDFIQYLNCPESFWLLKKHPEEYPMGEFSLFVEKLVKEGYEVEEYAKQLYPKGINLPDFASTNHTKNSINKGKVFFQASFATSNDVFARVDILKKNDDNTYNLYEVKSSTDVKTDKKHNHIKDVCFQKYVLENTGINVRSVYIIHLNKEYIRNGDIDINSLLKTVDVTEQTDSIYEETVQEINEATDYLHEQSISQNGCSCRQKTRTNHCDAFYYFNTDIPEFSIFDINRITQKRLREITEMGILDISKVGEGIVLNEKQKLQIDSSKLQKAIINPKSINEQLEKLVFPLHFIDYETYASAIPQLDGVKSHQHIPFQVSIHSMYDNGDIKHYEFLADKFELPEKLITGMQKHTGTEGTFISWHASFEKTINNSMIEMYRQHKEYLTYQNDNMFDLEDVFKKDYVDYRFKGSTSIKKVLPILIPKLSYDSLEVQNGTMAMDIWGKSVLDSGSDLNISAIRKSLLEYCKLDTLAMVEIYKCLIDKVRTN